MCEIYNFPVKKQLPKELEEQFQKIAKEYVKLMNNALAYFGDENSTNEEMVEHMEIILNIYLNAISKAIEECDES